jgi:hypothetical protein
MTWQPEDAEQRERDLAEARRLRQLVRELAPTPTTNPFVTAPDAEEDDG